MSERSTGHAGRDDFATTHWTLVLAASDDAKGASRQALAELCQTYWYPLYAYIRRRVGDANEAQDVTQAFFAHLLERGIVADADPHRGRFRAFLLTACKRFMVNEWHKAHAQKRGGGRRPLPLDLDSGESKYALVAVDPRTAEQLFDQQWAMTLLDRVLGQLRADYIAKGKETQFAVLKPFLAGASADQSYADAAGELGISEVAAKVAAHRMRKRYRELLRAEIAQTVERPRDIDDEIGDLFEVLGSTR